MPRACDRGRHLIAPALDHLGQAVDDLSAIVRRALRPVRSGFGRRLNGVPHVLSRALRNVGEELVGPLSLVNGKSAPALGAYERTADINFGGLGYRNPTHKTDA